MLKASYVFYYIILVIIPSGDQVGTVSSAIVLILKMRICFTATDRDCFVYNVKFAFACEMMLCVRHTR